MKPKWGICKECNDEKEKPLIKGLCKYHYWKERSRLKGKPRKKATKRTGEFNFFEAIFDQRKKVCFVTGLPLRSKEFYIQTNTFHFLFHHVLGKGAYPAFRLYEKNIIMVLPEVHDNIETKALSDLVKIHIGYQKVIDLKETLKSEYYGRTHEGTI
jgi:hypothetical protein